MRHPTRTSLLSGIAFGIGVLAVVGGYFLVQAVAPGTVTNPNFGPNDADVDLAFPVTITSGTASKGGGGPPDTTNLGAHDYCALSNVASGGDDSSCEITRSGADWILQAHSGNAQTQACAAYCMDF